MSVNTYQPHLLILPEDEADRQIANGFILDDRIWPRRVQVLKESGGWRPAVRKYKKNIESGAIQFRETRIVLLIDFDTHFDSRMQEISDEIDGRVRDRFFVVGTIDEPEALKSALGLGFEQIGQTLAKECAEGTCQLWEHDMLSHNREERDRLFKEVKPFLFR